MMQTARLLSICALLLAGCATPPSALETSCPYDLSYIEDDLTATPEAVREIIGEEAMEKTLTRPIDEMVQRGGGIDVSIASGQSYVSEYKAILAEKEKVREDYLALGKDDLWVDWYLMTVADGVTINQAFVDAVNCRRIESSLKSGR